MIEIAGIVFGGVSRLAQHYMETRDKKDERNHEAIMFDKQIALGAQRFEEQKTIKSMEIASATDTNELNALLTAIQSQASEAKAAGGWAASLSATVRPMVTYFLLLLYAASKISIVGLSLKSQVPFLEAIASIYSEFDGALLGSIVSFWFADRSLRKASK